MFFNVIEYLNSYLKITHGKIIYLKIKFKNIYLMTYKVSVWFLKKILRNEFK